MLCVCWCESACERECVCVLRRGAMRCVCVCVCVCGGERERVTFMR